MKGKTVGRSKTAITQVAKITLAIDKLKDAKVVRIDGNVVYLFPELLKDTKQALSWMTNLYTYCRLVKSINTDETLYFKDIESQDVLGFYKDGKPVDNRKQ